MSYVDVVLIAGLVGLLWVQWVHNKVIRDMQKEVERLYKGLDNCPRQWEVDALVRDCRALDGLVAKNRIEFIEFAKANGWEYAFHPEQKSRHEWVKK